MIGQQKQYFCRGLTWMRNYFGEPQVWGSQVFSLLQLCISSFLSSDVNATDSCFISTTWKDELLPNPSLYLPLQLAVFYPLVYRLHSHYWSFERLYLCFGKGTVTPLHIQRTEAAEAISSYQAPVQGCERFHSLDIQKKDSVLVHFL